MPNSTVRWLNSTVGQLFVQQLLDSTPTFAVIEDFCSLLTGSGVRLPNFASLGSQMRTERDRHDDIVSCKRSFGLKLVSSHELRAETDQLLCSICACVPSAAKCKPKSDACGESEQTFGAEERPATTIPFHI